MSKTGPINPIDEARAALERAARALLDYPGTAEGQQIAQECRAASDAIAALPPPATETGAIGGSARSDRKTASSRANGAKGGRPRKTPPTPE